MISDRTIRYYHGHRVIAQGNTLLRVEERDLYTSYRLETYRGTILWHDVRNCYPLPNYQPHIIYARTIPWFMWIIYGFRDFIHDLCWKWTDFQQKRAEKKKQKAIRSYQKRVSESHFVNRGRYGGRYNR